MVLHLNKLESLHPKIFVSLVKIGPVVLKKIFKFCQCIFTFFVIISPWKRAGPFIWTNLIYLQPSMLSAKFIWKLVRWFWRRIFSIFVNVFSLFYNYLSLEKHVALLLNKLESPSSKDALCQVWLNWSSGSGEDENVKSLRQRKQRRRLQRQVRRTTDKFDRKRLT